MTSSNKMSEEIKSSATVRTSVSIPCGLHNELEKLARDKRVSLAWVIRDAAEKYVADQGRLLSGPKSAWVSKHVFAVPQLLERRADIAIPSCQVR